MVSALWKERKQLLAETVGTFKGTLWEIGDGLGRERAAEGLQDPQQQRGQLCGKDDYLPPGACVPPGGRGLTVALWQ
jgi:hypothetical protein